MAKEMYDKLLYIPAVFSLLFATNEEKKSLSPPAFVVTEPTPPSSPSTGTAIIKSSATYDTTRLYPLRPRRAQAEKKVRPTGSVPLLRRAGDVDIGQRNGVEGELLLMPKETGELEEGEQRGEAAAEAIRAGMRDVGASDRWDGYEGIIDDQHEITVGLPCSVDDLASLMSDMKIDEAEGPPANENYECALDQLLDEEYEVPIFLEDQRTSSDQRALDRERWFYCSGL